MSSSAGTGRWLEKALLDLCKNRESGLDLDGDLISGLVSYCELAPPEDAREYLNNIVGEEAGQSVIEEYLRMRGHAADSSNVTNASTSKLQAYVKPPQDTGLTNGTKRQPRAPKEAASSSNKIPTGNTVPGSNNKVNSGSSKKKKAGKVVSLAEASKGTIVFKQGNPCSCQARRHRLISNCLSCGKIVCEQEGEGPCSFCGALVLKEGSTYAGLEQAAIPLSDAEAAAEAFTKRLVDYDRNSTSRTTVIDDQSDYYDEGNKWASPEEQALLKKKQEEIEQADQLRRSKVVVTFDLVGRKVVTHADEASEQGSENRILRMPDERESIRVKPNPTLRVQPVFVLDHARGRPPITRPVNGVNLEFTGRVQYDLRESRIMAAGPSDANLDWQGPYVHDGLHMKEEQECSLDYN